MIHKLRANLAQMMQMVADGNAVCRLGLVTSYDPAQYAVKVQVQPNAVETGWLPVGAMWAGPGWGMFCPPSPGNQAMVFFQEADQLTGLCGFVLFSDGDRPLNVPSGEFWLVHQSGSFLKITNDGKLSLSDASGASQVFNNDGTITFSADVIVKGKFSNTGAVSLAGGGPAVARVGDPTSETEITGGSSNVQSG